VQDIKFEKLKKLKKPKNLKPAQEGEVIPLCKFKLFFKML